MLDLKAEVAKCYTRASLNDLGRNIDELLPFGEISRVIGGRLPGAHPGRADRNICNLVAAHPSHSCIDSFRANRSKILRGPVGARRRTPDDPFLAVDLEVIPLHAPLPVPLNRRDESDISARRAF